MGNFKQRIITGLILVILIVGSIIAGAYSFVFLIFLINFLALNEFYQLFKCYSPQKISGMILSLGLMVSMVLVITAQVDWKILLINLPIAFSLFVYELFTNSDIPFVQLSFTFLGLIYVTVPCIFLLSIPFLSLSSKGYHSDIVLALFFIVWASDSGAYVAGKKFGNHRLFERVSPNKTWEGSFGGAFCVLITVLIISWYYVALNLFQWIVVGLIAIVIGTLGDLIKSRLKRSLQLKDSGTILPGHGGMLDRFDSLLASAPFVVVYLLCTNIDL